MEFIAEIDIMPHKELLDPQGKAVHGGLDRLAILGVQDVRVGKHIQIRLVASTEEEATSKVEEACKKLLANAIMEHYTFSLHHAPSK